ncbi:MAG TPA: UvrD-helicase domain-containing protein, partial [bacterium]|nr:UvrD-helicase domain-containing protein [bacterium]
MNFILSPDQQNILNLSSGKHVVAAPPGTGKTELLVRRLKKALDQGFPPEKMACLTFTNRAARNMQERIGDIPDTLHVGNFHAFCIKYLKRIRQFTSHNAILDEEDAEMLLTFALDHWIPDSGMIPNTSDDPILDEIETAIDPEILRDFNMEAPRSAPLRPERWPGRADLKNRL